MATAVDAALAEIVAAISAITPPREGLGDFSRIGLHSDTQDIVQQTLAQYDERFNLLTSAKSALDALIADGYPVIPVVAIAPSPFEDLKDNTATINAAFAQFSEATATALGLSSGSPEPK